MAYSVEKISGNQVKITFTVPNAHFLEAVQKAYLKMRGRINIPGFRKGKAPRKLIENMYGESVFYEEALDVLFPDVYSEAVDGEHLQVVDRPEMDEVKEIGADKDLQFSVKVYVSPDIELGDYKGLKATRYAHEVTDEEVNARIDQDVRKATTTADVTDRALESGDTAKLDYAGTVDGVAFDGGTAKDQTLKIGSGTFIPGFEDQMIGMQIGEERDLKVTFPTPYQSEALAGKDAVFHVKLNGIQADVKPELDDEFAKDVSDFDTFDAYKADIRAKLQDRADKNSDIEVENALVQAAVDASDCDIPEAMVDTQLDAMMREMRMNMAYQGIRFEDYLKYMGLTEDQVKEQYRSEAHNRVKMRLVLEAIGAKENVEVTDEDVDKAIAEEAENEGRKAEDLKASLNDRQMEYLQAQAKNRKIMDIIKENAVIEKKTEADRISAKEAADAVTEAAKAVENVIAQDEAEEKTEE